MGAKMGKDRGSAEDEEVRIVSAVSTFLAQSGSRLSL